MRVLFIFLFTMFYNVVKASGDVKPAGARSAGMGTISVTLADPWACFNNPANLDFYRKYSAAISYENRFLLKELGLHSFASSIPVKGGTFGLSVSSFGYSLYRENKYGLAFSKSFGTILSFGLQADYFSIAQAEGYGKKNTATVDFGITSNPYKNLIIGAHVFNPTSQLLDEFTKERLPTIFKAGMEYRFSEKVFIAMEGEKNLQGAAQFKAGIEYMPLKDFYLRTGISTGPATSHFGFGWKIKHFQVDMAAEIHSVLGVSPNISLSYEVN